MEGDMGDVLRKLNPYDPRADRLSPDCIPQHPVNQVNIRGCVEADRYLLGVGREVLASRHDIEGGEPLASDVSLCLIPHCVGRGPDSHLGESQMVTISWEGPNLGQH